MYREKAECRSGWACALKGWRIAWTFCRTLCTRTLFRSCEWFCAVPGLPCGRTFCHKNHKRMGGVQSANDARVPRVREACWTLFYTSGSQMFLRLCKQLFSFLSWMSSLSGQVWGQYLSQHWGGWEERAGEERCLARSSARSQLSAEEGDQRETSVEETSVTAPKRSQGWRSLVQTDCRREGTVCLQIRKQHI